jgi:hypothetical protein
VSSVAALVGSSTASLTAGVWAIALEVPKLPALSDDPDVIAVVDVLRAVILVAGLAVAALCLRQAWTVPRTAPPGVLTKQFSTRAVALAVALVYITLGSYERLGDEVRLQFILGLIFLVLAFVSVHHAAAVPPRSPTHEEQLRAITPSSGSTS